MYVSVSYTKASPPEIQTKLKMRDTSIEFGYSRYTVLLMDKGYQPDERVAPFILGNVPPLSSEHTEASDALESIPKSSKLTLIAS